jgi:hypothetical protein
MREVQGRDSADHTPPDFGEGSDWGGTPVWEALANQVTATASLPDPYDVSGLVDSRDGGALTYEMGASTDPLFTVSGAGIITAGVGLAVQNHTVTVIAANDRGDASASFTWQVTV